MVMHNDNPVFIAVPDGSPCVPLHRWRCEMVNTPKPSREQVRAYMERRQAQHQPPPSCQEIRQQLGWELGEEERKERSRQR
jgi:hypothetical protein